MRFVCGSRAGALARVIFLAAAVLCGALPLAALAQSTQTPTPSQIESFRNLSPDQQQQVLDAMGAKGDSVRRDAPLSMPVTSEPVSDLTDLPAIQPPRVGPRSTLLLEVTLRESSELVAAGGPERKLLSDRRARILQGNPYELDEEGRISLPLAPPINLTGLTDVQVAQLLNADPRLAGLGFAVTLLPVEPTGNSALKPFGYDLFDQVPTTFAPATDIPVPSDYTIGPGDNVLVELFGKKDGRYQLVVDRAGRLTVPELGPVQVSGLSFDQLRSEIEQRVAERMIGVRASVTMGELRSIRIFVVGDVARPGAYTVSGLATITNALFASGGVARIGSLRNISLKRGQSTIARLDLYDLLLRGDTSQDQQLQQGDAIFVAPVGGTAGVAGYVRRPAIYELRGQQSVADLIELAGGLREDADPRLVRLERIDENRERTVLDLNLSNATDRARRVVAGDVLVIPQVLADVRGVTLHGHVQRPGAYAWREGMRLTDLLGSMSALKLNADQRYVLIRREHSPDRRLEALSADAVRAFAAPGSQADPLLQARDRVIVFSMQADRGAVLADLLQELRMQARDNSPVPIVSISGRVRAPGDYPLEPNMSAADLVRAGGGLDEAAYPSTAELTRHEVVDGQSRKTAVVQLEFAGNGAGNEQGQATRLRAYDMLVVKETPDWREQETVTLRGEVRFPGIYPIRSGERLSSVIERAGGLTEASFAQGSVFMRVELQEQEMRQLETMANRLQSDLALASVQSAQSKNDNSAQALAAGQSLLSQLRSARPTGRLVVDLQRALEHKDSVDDIELRGGDELVVPRFRPYVTVIGEVQNGTSHVWKPGLSRSDYVGLSGGTTSRADEARIYVVRANGSVVASGSRSWFGGQSAGLEPGDTVVVPIDAERMRPLTLWTAVTTIVYNMAVAVAAIGSL